MDTLLLSAWYAPVARLAWRYGDGMPQRWPIWLRIFSYRSYRNGGLNPGSA
jgi:hypothetical protein